MDPKTGMLVAGGIAGTFAIMLVASVIFLALAIFDRWQFAEVLKSPCLEGVTEVTLEATSPQVRSVFTRVFGNEAAGGSLRYTFKCVVAPGEDAAPTLQIRPDDPALATLVEPLICSATLHIDEHSVTADPTGITEIAPRSLQPLIVPMEASQGPATLFTSCQVDELTIEQVIDVNVVEPEG